MSKIWKYPIRVQSKELIVMPKGAKVLKLVEQGGLPYIYVLVDPDETPVTRVFRTVTSGEQFNSDAVEWVDTAILDGWFVIHLFEVTDPKAGPDPVDDDPRWRGDYKEYRDSIENLIAVNTEGQTEVADGTPA